jgi:hypothetical protein
MTDPPSPDETSPAHGPAEPENKPQRGNKNQRAFAVNAPPQVIWRTLLNEVRQGVKSGRVQIVHEQPPRALCLHVRLGWGLYVRYDYDIRRTHEHTEVAVTVAPYGIRHAIANIMSLGRGTAPYMVAVTQGLANLKDASENADSH